MLDFMDEREGGLKLPASYCVGQQWRAIKQPEFLQFGLAVEIARVYERSYR